jgi:hypothetical protein
MLNRSMATAHLTRAATTNGCLGVNQLRSDQLRKRNWGLSMIQVTTISYHSPPDPRHKAYKVIYNTGEKENCYHFPVNADHGGPGLIIRKEMGEN